MVIVNKQEPLMAAAIGFASLQGEGEEAIVNS